MQRLRTHEDFAQMTDELDVITFRVTEDGMDIRRRVSDMSDDSEGIRDTIVVHGDNVAELGEWFTSLKGEGALAQRGNSLATNNDTYLNVAAIAVEALTEEEEAETSRLETGAVRGVRDLFTAVSLSPTRKTNEINSKAESVGLIIPDDQLVVLLASHKVGRLELARTSSQLPLNRVSELGLWIGDGAKQLVKKSVWGSTKS